MNAIIQEIHSAFSTAEIKLTAQLETEERRRKSLDPDKIKRLGALGFKATKEVRMLSPEEIEKARNLQTLVAHYRMYYPDHKFITEEAVTDICKKYGLVHAPVECYIDSIPEKNMDEILAFKVMDGDTESRHSSVNYYWNGEIVSSMDNEHLLNTARWINNNINSHLRRLSSSIARAVHGQYSEQIKGILYEMFKRGTFTREDVLCEAALRHGGMAGFRSTNYNKILDGVFSGRIDEGLRIGVREFFEMVVQTTTEYSIVAAKQMLDLTGYQIDPLTYRAEKIPVPVEISVPWFEDDDPIVLCKVKGGYLIVSAWGPEASDEKVFNEILN